MNSVDQTIPQLRHVSDTAWVVAALRATESERADALFHDPYARILLGDQGANILKGLTPGYDMSWFMAVRTAVLDEIVSRVIASEGIDCVVNLACGLDTRAYRLPLAAHVKWFDVDLPGVMTHRESALKDAKASCNVIPKAVDLSNDVARQDLLVEVSNVGKKILVITEGLLPYLSEKNVAGLAADLLSQPKFSLWLTDFYGSQTWNKAGNQFMEQLEKANIQIKFMPAEGPNFFPNHGWLIRESRRFTEEAIRLHRQPKKLDLGTSSDVMAMDPTALFEEARILLLTRK